MGKVEAAALIAGGLENFLTERSQHKDLANLVEIPLLYVGYLENGLDFGIWLSGPDHILNFLTA